MGHAGGHRGRTVGEVSGTRGGVRGAGCLGEEIYSSPFSFSDGGLDFGFELH